jgi:integrase
MTSPGRHRQIHPNAEPQDPAKSQPESSEPREERDAWTADELRRFLERVADCRLNALWLLAATTGMRRGELCGATWRDVALDAAHLVVRRSRVPVAGRGVVESRPKSGRERVIALAPGTVAVLRKHRKAQLAERLAWGAAWQDTGYVFTNEDGTPIRPDSITAAFNGYVAELGLRKIPLHGLRHTHITLGLAAGVGVKVMQKRVGHAKIETTYAYVHSLEGEHEAAASTVERLILGGS